MIQRIAILDTETSAVEPENGHLLEVAVALWSCEHRTTVRSYCALVKAPDNDAEDVNGIAPALVQGDDARPRADVMRAVVHLVDQADLVLAHFGDFDKGWLPELASKTWICSEDIPWPKPYKSQSLVSIALAHGVGVASAHRALDDVTLLARLLERACELSGDLDAMLAHAMRPKKLFQALVSFEEKDKAKAARFMWDAAMKRWTRKMAPEDTAALDFKVREVAA